MRLVTGYEWCLMRNTIFIGPRGRMRRFGGSGA